MANAVFGLLTALLFRERCAPIIGQTGLIKSSFIRGRGDLELKVRCNNNDLKIDFTEPLGLGCVDPHREPLRYNRMIQVINATCLPNEVYEVALSETITHVLGGRARLFIADPAEVVLVDDLGYQQMAPRMRAVLEDDVRKFAYNPAVYVRIGIHPYGNHFTILERASSVLASYADSGYYLGDSRFNETEILGFDASISRGVFLYENRDLILVGPAETHPNGRVYPTCFRPPVEHKPAFTVQLPTECAICMANVTSKKNCDCLRCGHVFHRRCMQEWRNKFTNGRRVTCPICRKEDQ